MTPASLVEGRRLVICCGPGGAGRTTCSVAIALELAAAGATVALVTIDPVDRFAHALGVGELGDEPVRVPAQRAGDGTTVDGELWVMALDATRSFDDLVDRVAPGSVRAATVKSNRIYRALSTATSGSQEFSAMAKLLDLQQSGRFDALVLDTPSARQASELLQAPRRLSTLLGSRALHAVTGPAGVGLRMLGRGISPLAGTIGRLSGVELLTDVSAFLLLLGGMADGLSARAAQVEVMLRASGTSILLITSPEPEPVDETIWLGRTLAAAGLPPSGIVVNRRHRSTSGPPEADALHAAGIPPDLAARVAASAERSAWLARRDELSVSRLERSLGARPVHTVPQLQRDIDDLDAVWEVHGHLFG